MQHQDGTSEPRPLSEADRRWLDDALKSAMVDLGKRMADIKDSLDAGSGGGSGDAGDPALAGAASLEEREQLLDELMDLVDQIDLARGAQQQIRPGENVRAGESVATTVASLPGLSRTFWVHLSAVPPVSERLQCCVVSVCKLRGRLGRSRRPRFSLRMPASPVLAPSPSERPS